MIVICGRLPLHSKAIRRFVKWMNEQYPLRRKVTIHVHRYAELAYKGTGIKNNGYTLYGYYTQKGHIRVALGSLDETLSLILIAHELGHASQHQNKVPLTEQYADHYAVGCVLQFRESERTC